MPVAVVFGVNELIYRSIVYALVFPPNAFTGLIYWADNPRGIRKILMRADNRRRSLQAVTNVLPGDVISSRARGWKRIPATDRVLVTRNS